MELRPYQQEAINSIEEQWESGTNRTLLVLPTGCGKTIVFCKLTERLVGKGSRVLIMAHRGELLDQAANKLLKATGLRCAVEKAGESCLGSWFRVVVGSVQTLMREKRLMQFDPAYFDTIIVDEAHHCLTDGYRFRKGAVLAVTDRDLEYTKNFNPQAGPFWDRALVAAEGKAMASDLQNYMNRGK